MHIAMIPARMKSQGFKFKNRKFFQHTANFLDQIKWINQIIVSTDDPVIKNYTKDHSYQYHKRPEELAGPAVSIKDVFSCVIKEMNIKDDDILWLFYLPFLYREKSDFEKVKPLIEKSEIKSLCSFIKAKSHPFNCWRYDEKNKKLSQYIENDVFRRQDLPPAWEHYHYICCFKASEIDNLNSELINSKTYPIFLDNKITEKLIEIDKPEDYEKWKLMNH
jgi:CMP-N-acetylneuraminic acid synthetase